jgi:pimeloyl-ACP methyl ester carboxylesterase
VTAQRGAPAPAGSPVSRVVTVDGVPMSALLADAADPRAVIVALHGGASKSVYWDCPDRPRLSLLRAAAAVGFTVLALDRPGYGASAGHAAQVAAPRRRVELAYAAADRLLAGRPTGAGVFVLGHSIGCELAVRMAADPAGPDLLGLDLLGVGLSGTGREHNPAAAPVLAGWRPDTGWPRRGAGLRELLWRPAHAYPDELIGGAAIGSPSPPYEATVVDGWAERDFAALAARVRVPVHFTLGEYEPVWLAGLAALADIAGLFTASPRVIVHEQVGGGHNLSVGLAAAAYHLQVLSFVEECMLWRGGRRGEEP